MHAEKNQNSPSAPSGPIVKFLRIGAWSLVWLAVTTNCTTTIRAQHPAAERIPWDWRILLNGKGDELMYERRAIVAAGLPFDELKKRALVNPAAQAADDAADFSARIRASIPAFQSGR